LSRLFNGTPFGAAYPSLPHMTYPKLGRILLLCFGSAMVLGEIAVWH